MSRYITNTPTNMYIYDTDNSPPFECVVELTPQVIESLWKTIRDYELYGRPDRQSRSPPDGLKPS